MSTYLDRQIELAEAQTREETRNLFLNPNPNIKPSPAKIRHIRLLQIRARMGYSADLINSDLTLESAIRSYEGNYPITYQFDIPRHFVLKLLSN